MVNVCSSMYFLEYFIDFRIGEFDVRSVFCEGKFNGVALRTSKLTNERLFARVTT